MAAERARGSELLRERFNEKDVIQLLELEHDGVELVEYFPIGIPAPDGVWGWWHVKPDVLTDLINVLIRHRKIPGIIIFPKGIPVPELFEVRFEAGSAREA
jgi:hypothetical protein